MGKISLILWHIGHFLVVGSQFLLALFNHDERLYKSRLSRPDEMRPLITREPPTHAMLLGTLPNGDFVAAHSTPKMKELGNMLILARTRGGKGLRATSQILSWDGPIVVNDIKGEFRDQTAWWRSRKGGKIYTFNAEGWGDGFDPLHRDQTEDDFYDSATHLLDTGETGETRVFIDRAVTMLVQLFLASRIEKIPPLVYVRYMIRLGLPKAAAHLNAVSPELATQFLGSHFDPRILNDKFLGSCWGTMEAPLRRMLTETVIRSLTKCDFTPEEILCSEKPVTLYVQIPERRLNTLAPLIRLFYGTLLNEMIDIYDKRKGVGCRDILYLIDEAGRTKIPALADLASTVVGRKMSLCMDFQSLSQMEIVYGKAGMQIILDNMDTQLIYRPAVADIKLANYLQERLGPHSAYAYSQTLRDGEETSEGRVERPIPLFASQDIMLMDNENVFAFHQNNRPMELKRVDWRKNAILQARHGSEPGREAPPLKPLSPVIVKDNIGTPLSSNTDLIDPDKISLRRRHQQQPL